MGLFGVIGGVLSGLGLFRGGSGVGRVAKSLAADTGKTLGCEGDQAALAGEGVASCERYPY